MRYTFGLFLVAALFFIGGTKSAKADALTVIPPRFELFGNPGDTVTEKIKITNDSPGEVSLSTEVDDFKAGDDEGSVDFVDPSEPTTSYRMAKWITVEPARFTVAAGQEKTIDVAIRIPRNAEAGGHFASVLVKRAGADTPGGASTETRIGSLILMRVSGDVKEAANVESFLPAESFAQYGPVTFVLRTKNNGNVHVVPTGTIVINNIFGRKVAEIPLTTASILPGASRNTRTEWGEKNLVGRYTATLVASYGQNKSDATTLSATTSFIVFPLYILWIALAVIAFIFFIFSQRKNLKKALNRLTSD